MSLLSINIANTKRLSIKNIILHISKQIEIKTTILPISVANETALGDLITTRPLVRELIKRLELIDIEIIKPQNQKITHNQIIPLSKQILKEQRCYSKNDIISKIIEITKVSLETAENSFDLMLKMGAIEKINKPELYYLGSSTPF